MAPEREFSLSKKSFQQADSTFQNDKPFWKVRRLHVEDNPDGFLSHYLSL